MLVQPLCKVEYCSVAHFVRPKKNLGGEVFDLRKIYAHFSRAEQHWIKNKKVFILQTLFLGGNENS